MTKLTSAAALSYFGTGNPALAKAGAIWRVLRFYNESVQRFDRLRGEAAMELRLSQEEERLLVEVLRQYQRELMLEISHTSHHAFKTRLRERARVLETVLQKLGAWQCVAS